MEEWYPKEKACIVGHGQTEYTKWGQIKRTEFQLALEAILAAVDDAGLTMEDIDGICSYANDRNLATLLAHALGMPQLRFSNMYWGGGGAGGSGAVMNACLAVATGTAKYVIVFRALAQGQFGRFGQGHASGTVDGELQYRAPYGFLTPAHRSAAFARRHMHQYGTTSRHYGAISVACYKHAQRNPAAVMYGRPLTIEGHQSSRMIADPLHLYDCCLENDGSAAIVVTSAERARDMRHRPVYVVAAAQGMDYRAASPYWAKPDYASGHFAMTAADLFARAGITPKDIDVAQIYENFTSATLMAIEEHGFCKRGEGGPFGEGGNLEWPDGGLPLNTSGGNIAECYMHGFELVIEAVRQMRGTSTCQVKDAEFALVASGPDDNPVSNMIVRR